MDLPVQKTRLNAIIKTCPTYSLIDSRVQKRFLLQTNGELMAEKIKGRKRHIITDVMGNLLKVVVGAANIHDTFAGYGVFKSALRKYPFSFGCLWR